MKVDSNWEMTIGGSGCLKSDEKKANEEGNESRQIPHSFLVHGSRSDSLSSSSVLP